MKPTSIPIDAGACTQKGEIMSTKATIWSWVLPLLGGWFLLQGCMIGAGEREINVSHRDSVEEATTLQLGMAPKALDLCDSGTRVVVDVKSTTSPHHLRKTLTCQRAHLVLSQLPQGRYSLRFRLQQAEQTGVVKTLLDFQRSLRLLPQKVTTVLVSP